ncbi:MAG TPA: alkaline phosphatase family protein, partial [Polyangiaceae bacterium]
LLLVYYTDLDSVQHETGAFSDRAYATLEKIDGQVQRLVDAASAIGIADDTTFVVVSDHGFADVDKAVRPAVALAKAGLIDVEGGRVRDWKVGLLPAGGMCGVVLKNPSDAKTRERAGAVLDDLAKDKRNGIEKIDGEADIAKMEGFGDATWALEAAPGFYFSNALGGEIVGPAGEGGTHGYRADHADMHASIIAAGPAVTRRGDLGLVHTIDVAPTIANVLGLSLPTAEGQAITGIGP